MSGNGLAERKRALNDLFAGIDALREAEDPLTAIDAIPGKLQTAIEALSAAVSEMVESLVLEVVVVDAIRRAGPYRELRDGVFNKKDQLRGLLDDWDAKRKAEAEEAAEKARDPRSKSDYAVLKAIKATLDEQDTDLVRIRHVDLVTKIKDDLNKLKEEFEAEGLDPSNIEQNINSLANVNNVLGGVKHLKKLGDITVYHGQDGAHIYGLGEGPGDAPVPVEEPEPARYRVEPGICRECGRPTGKAKNGRPYRICKSCHFGKDKKPEPLPLRLAEDEPEPAPVPVPASTALLDAKPVEPKPEDVVLAELTPTRRPLIDATLAKIGHWHSTGFTVEVVKQLVADGGKPTEIAVLRGIMAVLEWVGRDSVAISRDLLAGIAGVQHPPEPAANLKEKGYITRNVGTGRTPTIYGLAPGFASTLECDTSEYSTGFTVEVVKQLVADGGSVQAANVLWAWMAALEGPGVESRGIPSQRIADDLLMSPRSVQYHMRVLEDLGYVKYRKGFVLGLGPKLSGQ